MRWDEKDLLSLELGNAGEVLIEGNDSVYKISWEQESSMDIC